MDATYEKLSGCGCTCTSWKLIRITAKLDFVTTSLLDKHTVVFGIFGVKLKCVELANVIANCETRIILD
jgi:hypothetical protein